MFYIVSNFGEYELTEEEKIKKEKIEKRKNENKIFDAIFLPRLKDIFNEVELEVDKDDVKLYSDEIEFRKEVSAYDRDEFCLRELVENKIKEIANKKLKNLGIDEYDLHIAILKIFSLEKSLKKIH